MELQFYGQYNRVIFLNWDEGSARNQLPGSVGPMFANVYVYEL